MPLNVLTMYLSLPGKRQWLGWHDQNSLPGTSQKKTQHGVIQIPQELQTLPFTVTVTLQGPKTLVFSKTLPRPRWKCQSNLVLGMTFGPMGSIQRIYCKKTAGNSFRKFNLSIFLANRNYCIMYCVFVRMFFTQHCFVLRVCYNVYLSALCFMLFSGDRKYRRSRSRSKEVIDSSISMNRHLMWCWMPTVFSLLIVGWGEYVSIRFNLLVTKIKNKINRLKWAHAHGKVFFFFF